jgi:hypothetical protein
MCRPARPALEGTITIGGETGAQAGYPAGLRALGARCLNRNVTS